MALEQVPAVVVLMAVAAVALLIGRAWGRASADGGAGTRRANASDGMGDASLFGADVPVRSTERQLVATMPESLIVADGRCHAVFVSDGAKKLPLVENGALAFDEIQDILRLVATDSVVRDRELAIPLDRARSAAAKNTGGKGLEAGKHMPADTLYVHVRIGRLADDLFAIFLSDMSEQRRFEIMRRDFVTNVSHELKTPAGAISLLAETIGDASDDPDAVKYFAGRISKESQRLTELVHRLIDLQKAQSATAMLDTQRLSALDVAREAIAENQVKADSKHIALVLSLNGKTMPVEDGDIAADSAESAESIDIEADPDTIKTAVKNLVENAVNYSPEHTTVTVAVGNGSGKNADKVTIRVVDQGIGIPEDSLDRIFERFYRVDPARSRETGGTGLGLAITKHCVQDCGGTIAVWSHEGEGSTFTITLPKAPAVGASGATADAMTDATTHGAAAGVPAASAVDAISTSDAATWEPKRSPNTTENTEENH